MCRSLQLIKRNWLRWQLTIKTFPLELQSPPITDCLVWPRYVKEGSVIPIEICDNTKRKMTFCCLFCKLKCNKNNFASLNKCQFFVALLILILTMNNKKTIRNWKQFVSLLASYDTTGWLNLSYVPFWGGKALYCNGLTFYAILLTECLELHFLPVYWFS